MDMRDDDPEPDPEGVFDAAVATILVIGVMVLLFYVVHLGG